jgi:uncharacterized protein (DUF2344 family)
LGVHKETYYLNYIESTFSGSRYDVEYKKSISNYDNGFIKEFKKINDNIYYVERIKEMDKNIQSTNKLIDDIKVNMENIESSIKNINFHNAGIDSSIVALKNKDNTYSRKKNKIAIGGRIAKFVLNKE